MTRAAASAMSATSRGVDLERGRPADDGDADEADRPRQRAPNVVDNGMGDPLRFDGQRLRILIERHLLYTGSARARLLLDDWDNTLAAFVKVTPRDYRRALLELQGRARKRPHGGGGVAVAALHRAAATRLVRICS